MCRTDTKGASGDAEREHLWGLVAESERQSEKRGLHMASNTVRGMVIGSLITLLLVVLAGGAYELGRGGSTRSDGSSTSFYDGGYSDKGAGPAQPAYEGTQTPLKGDTSIEGGNYPVDSSGGQLVGQTGTFPLATPTPKMAGDIVSSNARLFLGDDPASPTLRPMYLWYPDQGFGDLGVIVDGKWYPLRQQLPAGPSRPGSTGEVIWPDTPTLTPSSSLKSKEGGSIGSRGNGNVVAGESGPLAPDATSAPTPTH